MRQGTRLFRPDARVYLASLRHSWALFPDHSEYPETIQVIGQHRKSRQWLLSWVRAGYTANWRVQLVYQPAVLTRLEEAEWPGFLLPRDDFACPEAERGTEAAVKALLEKLRDTEKRRWQERHRSRQP
jgi:hypothetical protein